MTHLEFDCSDEKAVALLQAARLFDEGVKPYEWIDANDRLPEEMVDVLVWFEYFRYGSYNCLFRTYGIGDVFNGKWSGFVNGTSGWHQLKIIAWMPLPKPPTPKMDASEIRRIMDSVPITIIHHE